jgi:hypothetical protein
MTSEFYEQLGIDRTASAARIRQAYGQACARLAKRRRALVEQGGSTAQLDLQRARLDEAWSVLADPLRRRRYDAMLGWAEGTRAKDPEVVWTEVREALVHPAAAVAAKLLRVTARLTEIGQLPLAPSGAAEDPETLIPHDDDLTTPRAARLGGRPSGGRPTDAGDTTSPRLTMPRPSAQRTLPPSAIPHPTPAAPPPRELLDLGERPTPAPAASRPTIPPLSTPAPAPPRPTATPAPAAPRPSAPPLGTPAPGLRPTPGPAPSRPPSAAPRVAALAPEVVAELVDDNGYSGRFLATVRQRMGLGVQDVADHTRISVKYLEALESEARAQLPSATFVRGYVREMARLYQLDVDAVVAGYMRRFDG